MGTWVMLNLSSNDSEEWQEAISNGKKQRRYCFGGAGAGDVLDTC